MRIEPEISGASLVFVGAFNPAIFHPEWLFNNQVEDRVDPQFFQIDVCVRDLSRFSVSDRNYLIDVDRFSIQTSVAPWINILDRSVLIFSQALPHSPIHSFGINRDIHFQVGSFETRTSIGRKLAPTEPWGQYGKDMLAEQPKDAGGMVSLTMRSVVEADDFRIHKNLKIEPSVQIKGNCGIYMQSNFHFELKNAINSSGAIRAITLAQDYFEDVLFESEQIFDEIMGLA